MIEIRSSRAVPLPPLPAQARIQLSSRWWPALAVAAFILSGAGSGCFDTQARAQDAPPGNVANGRSVYLKVNCFQCHGRAGQGGAMNYPAPPLAETSMPFEGFKMVVRES